MNITDRVARALRFPKTILVVLAVLTLAIGHRAIFVVQDNSPESFFAVEPEAQQTYHRLVEAFGVDEVLLVELRGARVDRAEDLRAVADLARRLAELPEVRDVMSVADGYDDPSKPLALPDDSAVEAVRSEVEAVALYRQLGLARPDIPALGVMAALAIDGPESRPGLIAAVRAELERFEQAGYEPAVVGVTAAHVAVEQEGQATMTLFMPLVVLLIGLIGFGIFRSVRALIAMIVPVGGAVLVGVATLELTGKTMNLVSGVMPPLVMAIGFAGATHLVSRYATLSAEGLAPVEAVQQTVRDKLFPTAFAFATTAVGFGSLLSSGVPTVQVLGGVSAVALIAALVLVTLGTPALLLLLRPKMHMPAHRRLMLERAAVGSLHHRTLVIACAIAVFIPVGLGFRHLHTQMDGMDFLGEDVPARRDFRRLEAEGVGLNPLDLWIRKDVAGPAVVLEDARTLQQLAAKLEAEPLVTGTAGIHDLLEVVQFRHAGKTDLKDPRVFSGLLSEERRPEFEQRAAPFVHATEGLRLSVLLSSGDVDEVQALIGRVERAAEKAFPDAAVTVTGHYRLLIGTPAKLMSTLIWSLALSVGVIAVLFFIAFRSPRLVLGGMIANVSPVFIVVGLMGWLGVPVDVATVMVASVAFGVAVDDTFHYLHHRRKSGSIVRAAHVAGQGIVATTFMIAGGFAVLGLSGFYPVMRFGLLTSLAVLVALVVDGVLLPALVGDREEAVAHSVRSARQS